MYKKNTHRFNQQINKKLFVFLKKTDDKRKFKIKKIKENICHLFFKQSENKKEKTIFNKFKWKKYSKLWFYYV